MQSPNSIIKRFTAGFQLRSGIAYFLVAAWMARYTTFMADSSVGNTLRSLVVLRMTLLSNSMALVV